MENEEYIEIDECLMHIIDLEESVEERFCAGCGKGGAGRDCGYGEFDDWGDFECTHPDAENLECPCYETFCDECKKRYIANLSIEDN